MNIRPKVRNAVLVGALAAVTATAWGMSESMTYSPFTVTDDMIAEQPAAPLDDAVIRANDAVAPSDSLSPNESVVTTTAPIVEHSVQPPITVEERRLSEDERIQAQVMDKLASNERLSGKIGVEFHDAVVRLSGWTSTSGQAWRAGRDAGSIDGVRYVQNEIRPRVGGSVS
jgi:hyperosmotically inducible periplasmic protein